MRRRTARLHLELQRRARRQCLRELRRDDEVADPEGDETVRGLAQHQRVEHLPRLEQRGGRRGLRDDTGKLGLDRGEHRPTLPDSG